VGRRAAANTKKGATILVMKTFLSIILFLTAIGSYSQDSIKIRQIDSIAANINNSRLTVQHDTILKDHPELGLKMKTYVTIIVNGNELVKYVNHVNTFIDKDQVTRQKISSSAFYYSENKLIKVEEFVLEGNNKKEANWYYWDGKPIYHTLKLDDAESRAALLLTISNSMLKQFQSKL
jgi:hypothetical protein